MIEIKTMNQKICFVSSAFLGLITLPFSAFASCVDYPYTVIGAKIIPLENDNVKVISTYKVGIDFDDQDEVIDALEEARVEAKARISDLMSTTIIKECIRSKKKLSKSLLTKDPLNNQSKSINTEKIKSQLCMIGESTSALLKGVSDVGQCYEPGKHVVVTIGIKPESIAAASALGKNMKNIKSLNDINVPSTNKSNSSFNNVEGFSNVDSDF